MLLYVQILFHLYKLMENKRIHHNVQDDTEPILPIRADIATNKQTLFNHCIITIVLLSFCFIFRLLPQAQRIQVFQAKQWHNVEMLDLAQVNPFNRKIKIYLFQTNPSNPIDEVNQVQLFSLKDGVEEDRKLNVFIQDIEEYEKYDQGNLTYYIGDLHVLDKPFYRVKVVKFDRTNRQLQQILQTNDQGSQVNETIKNNDIPEKNETEEVSNTTNITNTSSEEEELKREQELRRQEEQRKRKEEKEQEEKRQKEEERKRIEQEERKQQERRKKQEQQKKKELKKTNLGIKTKVMTKFATILQFALNYLILLVIIYFVADNPTSPKSISLILTLTANPLIFIHLSVPSGFTNLLDSLCNSAPLLYLSIWMYYTHWQFKYESEGQSNAYLVIKLILSISIYFLNVLRLMHYGVSVLQTIFVLLVFLILIRYLWGMFLNLKQEEHRNKILVSLSIHYLILQVMLTYLAGGWKSVIGNIVCQIYGISLIVLMGRRKKLVITTWEEDQQLQKQESGRNLQAQDMNRSQHSIQ